MKLLFNRFLGEVPKLDPSLLPASHASLAKNIKIERGTLKPLRGMKFYRAASKLGVQYGLYRFAPVAGDPDSGWLFSWEKVVNCVPGAVAGNSQHLTYWTGDGYPKYTDNSIASGSGVLPKAWYKLGVPKPKYAPMAERIYVKPKPKEKDKKPKPGTTTKPPKVEEPKTDASLERDRDYVVTFVHQLGSLEMEGPPSLPSVIVKVPAEPGFGVNLTNLPIPPSGNYPVAFKRIYRRIYSSGLTQFSFVTQLAADVVNFSDTKSDAEIPGDRLVSSNFYPPKEDMHSLGVLVNGVMFGASGNDVCVSEAYLPHAWSTFSRYALPDPVVGLGQADSNIVAITLKNPYILTGQSPGSLTVVELKMDQGCLSNRSVVSGSFGCVYASPDGLVIIAQGKSRTLTDGLMTRKQWQALNPASMISAVNEDLLIVCFTRTNGTKGSFILNPKKPDEGMIFTDQYFTAHYHDGLLDSLLVYDPKQQKVCLWDEGDTLIFTWLSHMVIVPYAMCFRCARVEAKSYINLTFQVYLEGVVRYKIKVVNGQPFRLPSGYQGKHWQFGTTGTDEVRYISVAEEINELE